MFDILEKISQMREERGWTEYELASRSGLTQSTISTWYRRKQVPSVHRIEKVCNAFGITLSQFFLGDEEPFLISPEQKALLDNFSTLPLDVQEDLKRLINSILANR